MNQILKSVIYGKGTMRQVEFIADRGGMNVEEGAVFRMLHAGKGDLEIEQELGLDRKSRERIEESVRAKVNIAVFHCIDFTMFEEREMYN